MDMILNIPRKRLAFHVIREKNELEKIMPELPNDDLSYRLISVGGFSSIAFIRLLADKVGIRQLYASTLAVGKKHLTALDVMHQQGGLDKAYFVVGGIMRQGSQERGYGYFGHLQEVCDKNGWGLKVKNNHSKILLFDTSAGKYVLETSSNLNENPKIEQFAFEKNAELYEFYKQVFETIF